MKSAFADAKFREEVKLGAINSINWARVLAQITYYFYSWLRVTDQDPGSRPRISYAVPTGNFGDILAGFYAKRMGLPIDKLIVCTNQNDVLHRFFETGSYKKLTSVLTIAPSMDISVSSNFERYLFYLAGESAETLASWMNIFEKTGEVALPEHLTRSARSEFLSVSSSKEAIVDTMRSVYEKEKYLVCPHTATAVVAVKSLKLPSEKTVILATAHPAKFEEAIGLALHDQDAPERPRELSALFQLHTRSTELQNSLAQVQAFVRMKLVPKALALRKKTWSYLNLGIAVAAIAGIGLFVFNAARKRR